MALALTVGVAVPGWASSPGDSVDVAPTAQQLAGSVFVVDLRNSVYPVDLRNSVVPLVVRKESAGQTTVTVSSDVLFAFGSAEVAPDVGARLVALAGEIPDGASVMVVGHTDGIGADAANDALSLRRAENVVAALRAADPSLQLTAQGRGEREPVEPETSGGEDDPAARAVNRRVEISFPS